MLIAPHNCKWNSVIDLAAQIQRKLPRSSRVPLRVALGTVVKDTVPGTFVVPIRHAMRHRRNFFRIPLLKQLFNAAAGYPKGILVDTPLRSIRRNLSSRSVESIFTGSGKATES